MHNSEREDSAASNGSAQPIRERPVTRANQPAISPLPEIRFSLDQSNFPPSELLASHNRETQLRQNLQDQKTWLRRATGLSDLPNSVVSQIFTPREVNPQSNYQLLEFLGDAALHAGLIVTVMTAPKLDRPCHAAASCAGLASNEFLAKRAFEIGFSLELANLNPSRVYGSSTQ